MNDKCTLVRNYVQYRLTRWKQSVDNSATKADLANLRRGLGRKPGEVPQIWHILFERCPEELFGEYGIPTWGEWAIMLSLTMYALHQQGHDFQNECMNVEGYSLGKAVAKLVDSSNEDSIRNRFNIFATSSDIAECAWHLRGLVQLLRAKSIPLDYVRLSEDLYRFQNIDGAQRVRLNWGQDFYREMYNKNKQEENNNE